MGFALALAGCASPVEQRSSPTPESGVATRAHEHDGGATASRQQLPELKETSGLPDYLAYAALNNPGLEAAFNRWKAALERAPQASALPDPRFSYGYFIREVETRVGPQEQRVGVAQMFPWPGKRHLRETAAEQGAQAAQQQYEAVRLRLFDEARQAYYELYFLGRAIAVTTENLELLKYLEQVARAKYESGTALHGDVIKAQVELDKLRDRLRTLEDVRAPVTARLNSALNRPAGAPLPLPAVLTPGEPPADAVVLAARLAQTNPDLRGLDFMAAKEKAEIDLAKKEFYPDVTLGLDYTDTGSARMPGVTDSGKDAVMLSLAVNVPIWREKYRAGVREATSRRAATLLERRDRENRLATELELALFKFKDSERKVALYRDALIPKADLNLRVVQRAFEAGKADFLSLIDAERALLEFQLTYERARADRELGLAAVDRLTGGALNQTAPEEEKQP